MRMSLESALLPRVFLQIHVFPKSRSMDSSELYHQKQQFLLGLLANMLQPH